MNSDSSKKIQTAGSQKKCNITTCIHYAGGICADSDKNSECEFQERTVMQD